jgi:hypothetical protein
MIAKTILRSGEMLIGELILIGLLVALAFSTDPSEVL